MRRLRSPTGRTERFHDVAATTEWVITEATFDARWGETRRRRQRAFRAAIVRAVAYLLCFGAVMVGTFDLLGLGLGSLGESVAVFGAALAPLALLLAPRRLFGVAAGTFTASAKGLCRGDGCLPWEEVAGFWSLPAGPPAAARGLWIAPRNGRVDGPFLYPEHVGLERWLEGHRDVESFGVVPAEAIEPPLAPTRLTYVLLLASLPLSWFAAGFGMTMIQNRVHPAVLLLLAFVTGPGAVYWLARTPKGVLRHRFNRGAIARVLNTVYVLYFMLMLGARMVSGLLAS